MSTKIQNSLWRFQIRARDCACKTRVHHVRQPAWRQRDKEPGSVCSRGSQTSFLCSTAHLTLRLLPPARRRQRQQIDDTRTPQHKNHKKANRNVISNLESPQIFLNVARVQLETSKHAPGSLQSFKKYSYIIYYI